MTPIREPVFNRTYYDEFIKRHRLQGSTFLVTGEFYRFSAWCVVALVSETIAGHPDESRIRQLFKTQVVTIFISDLVNTACTEELQASSFMRLLSWHEFDPVQFFGGLLHDVIVGFNELIFIAK